MTTAPSPRMRVLHVVTSLAIQWGGPPRVVAALVEELAKRGVEAVIFASRLPPGAPLLPVLGAEVMLFPPSLLSGIWRGHSRRLAHALRASLSEFDLIHVHEPWNFPHYAACRLAQQLGKPYVVTPHGALELAAFRHKGLRKRLYFALVQRGLLQGATALQAITEAEAHRFRALGLKNPVALIPNGVHLEEFARLPPRSEFERAHPQLQGKTVLLFMGRLHPIKGLDLLAAAFARIAHERDDVSLVIAGPSEGVYGDELRQRLRHEVQLGQVVFTGMLTGDVRLAAFSRADVFILPARSEVRGLVTLEAMACNLPVVVTRECGFPEISQAEAGIIVPSTVADLTAAITRLADDANLRRMLGRNGRQLVERHYTWTRVADQMISLYRSVLDDPLHW